MPSICRNGLPNPAKTTCCSSWGVYDWGEGESFELEITRQFMIGGDAEDDSICKLSLTFKYVPMEELRETDSGNRWCGTAAPRGVAYFKLWIQDSRGYQVEGKRPDRVELEFECAG